MATDVERSNCAQRLQSARRLVVCGKKSVWEEVLCWRNSVAKLLSTGNSQVLSKGCKGSVRSVAFASCVASDRILAY